MQGHVRFFVAVVFVSLLLHSTGCNAREIEKSPEKAIAWDGNGKGLRFFGRSGPYIYGRHLREPIVDFWKWDGDSLQKVYEHENFGEPLSLGVANDRVLARCVGGFEIRDIRSGALLQSLPDKEPDDLYWLSEVSRSSMNGNYLAVWRDWRNLPHFMSRLVIGLFDGTTNEIRWIKTWEIKSRYMSSRHNVIPSDDGKLLAFASWDNAAALFDVEKKEFVWKTKPEHDIIHDAAFSPDGKTLYAAGRFGGVYSMSMTDGKILDTWYASLSGKQEYGHRISTMSISPDGKYLAVGTGPEGLIFVYSIEEKKILKVLQHGGGVVWLVYFSPDSARLATYANDGMLKIWRCGK